MKRLITLLMLVFAFTACSSSSDDMDEINEQMDPEGLVAINFYYQKTLLSTGEKMQNRLEATILHIWDANGRDFDFKKSSIDLLEGYLYDQKEGKSIKPITTAMYKDYYTKKLPVGKYAIYVYVAPAEYPLGIPRQSYTFFEVKEDQTTDLKKVFGIDDGMGITEKWE